MAKLITLKTFSDFRGDLTVIEKVLPFEIKRVYYIANVNSDIVRGGHCHHQTAQALICLNGSCIVTVKTAEGDVAHHLDKENKCLLLNPQDWHTMHHFSKGSVLLVLASTYFDSADYIHEDMSLKPK